ncbi:ssDNA endonuclease and repair protein rad10 [Ceratobasidium sp. UAMH 11750]|nr:ssDNA endonuclease and repair protein rad10 [Ceratobasidium sp. UAMH 11750]
MSQLRACHVTPGDPKSTTSHLMTDAQPTTSRAPVPQVPSAAAVKAAKRTGSNIIVSTRQKGNPVLDHVKQSWEYGDIVADYQVGATTGVLYLSLKYHHLHPQYIPDRFEKLGRSYDLRILLILCDVTEHQNSIKELTKACLLNQMTVMIAWSLEEAGKYLGTYKQYEFQSHHLIKERVDADYTSLLRAALTTVRGVNKTDVMTLRTNFGSFKNIAHATTEDLQLCPGFGPTKVRRLREAFNKPFHSSGQKPLGVPVQDAQPGLAGVSAQLDPGSREDALDEPEPQAISPTVRRIPTPPGPTARHSSPDWDLDIPTVTARPDADLDLDLELNPSDEETGKGVGANASVNTTMEVNPEDEPPTFKKRRLNE